MKFWMDYEQMNKKMWRDNEGWNSRTEQDIGVIFLDEDGRYEGVLETLTINILK